MARSSLWLATALATSAAGGAAAPDGTPDPAKAIDDYVAALAALRVDPPGLTQGPKSDPARDGDYSCTTQNLAETRQFDKVVAFAANSESLWPGAIVRGDSLYTGLFTQIVLPRAPLTFSVSLENLAGRKSATLEGPSLAAYREAMGRILDAEVAGATPANIGSEIEKVQSSQQLTL